MPLSQRQIVDTLDSQGVYGAITVGTTAAELKVGASKLSERAYVVIQPKTESVFFGYDNSVTTSTGVEIFKDQTFMLPIGDGVGIWLISANAGNDVRIQELT